MRTSLLVSRCLALAFLPTLTSAGEDGSQLVLDGGFGRATVETQAPALSALTLRRPDGQIEPQSILTNFPRHGEWARGGGLLGGRKSIVHWDRGLVVGGRDVSIQIHHILETRRVIGIHPPANLHGASPRNPGSIGDLRLGGLAGKPPIVSVHPLPPAVPRTTGFLVAGGGTLAVDDERVGHSRANGQGKEEGQADEVAIVVWFSHGLYW